MMVLSTQVLPKGLKHKHIVAIRRMIANHDETYICVAARELKSWNPFFDRFKASRLLAEVMSNEGIDTGGGGFVPHSLPSWLHQYEFPKRGSYTEWKAWSRYHRLAFLDALLRIPEHK